MAGREFGPPPNTVEEFGPVWRNWLYLLYRKVYKRSFRLFIQVINGIGDGTPENTLQEGLIGLAPVAFGDDSRTTGLNFSSTFPENWVIGTAIEFGITFANAQAQTGVKAVVTELQFGSTSVGEDLSLPGSAATITTALDNNVAATILNLATFIITDVSSIVPGKPFQFVLSRLGGDVADTCVGDVGYKEIVFKYTGYINHE